MNRATAQMRNCAKRLMACEALGNGSSGVKTRAAFQVCEKLQPHLATLVGNGGFRALLSRALALANAEVPWLREVHVKDDGTLEGFGEPHARIGPDKFFEGRVVLLAQLLGLLVAFIGPNLTLRLLRDVWPQVPLNDLDFGNGGKNERPK